MPKEPENVSELSINHPAGWDLERFRENWSHFFESLLKEEASALVPARRIRCQIEQTAAFQKAISGWEAMKGQRRLEAWKRLLMEAEEASRTMLPVCVRCGECCRMGSPTLHLEDLPLLKSGTIPWDQLITLRKGEPVRSPFDRRLFILDEERIKIREKEGSRECSFLVPETDGGPARCSIYSDRALQCRAQACWDPIPARDTAELPFLLRRHVFEGVDLLLEIISEHENRCGFEKLSSAFEELSRSNGGNVEEVLELLSYEEHFRQFVSEKFSIPSRNLELLFGRSFEDLTVVFGCRVSKEPGGGRCLVVDEQAKRGREQMVGDNRVLQGKTQY